MARKLHTIHFDRKRDLEHAVTEGILSVHWKHFRTNPLCPPLTTVDIREFRNDFVKAFSELMQFWQRGMSIFLMGVDQLYRDFDVYDRWHVWDWNTMQFPTLWDLSAVFKGKSFRKRIAGQGNESRLSIDNKLEGILIELEPIVSCQRGFDVQRLYEEKHVLSIMVEGLSMEHQNFLIVEQLLRYSHLFKVTGPRNQLNALFVFDEAKGIFGKTSGDKFIIKDLVSKVREWGIGIVFADQVPSEIAQAVFSNVGTLIMFRHSDGVDLQRLRYSSGATIDQMLDNYGLQPGQCVVRTMKCKDLHRIQVPFTPVEKFISRQSVDEFMKDRLEDLHRDVIPAVVDEPEAKKDRKDEESLSSDEWEFLRCLAADFNRASSAVYQELGFSESKGYRLKERLRKKRYITTVTTNLAGKRAVFLVPSPIVFEKLGIELGPGRGKAFHKYSQNRIKDDAEKGGFKAVIEDCVDGSKGPDVGVEKDGLRIAVEICVLQNLQPKRKTSGRTLILVSIVWSSAS